MRYLFLLFLISALAYPSLAQEKIVGELYFESSKSNLTAETKRTLDDLFMGNLLEQTASIQLIGHTDSVGTLSYNIALSKKRVDSIFHYLGQRLGIPPTKVTRSYHGETVPKYGANWESNRRVEIVINLVPKAAEPEPEPEPELEDKDIAYRDGCLTLEIEAGTFAPYKNSEVKFKVTLIEPENMAEYNVTLQDTAGNQLISGGMILFEATVNGKPVEQKKKIRASIPARPQSPLAANGMLVYTGVTNEEEAVEWQTDGTPCNTSFEPGESYTETDGCRTYTFSIPPYAKFVNCDVKCGSSMRFNSIHMPENSKDYVRSSEKQEMTVHFLDGKPEKVEFLHQPKPKRKLKAVSNSLTRPPMFQLFNLHKDLIIKCDPKAYDSNKHIRLFIPKGYRDSLISDMGTKNIYVYVGKMGAEGLIQWEEKPYPSEDQNEIHCFYHTYKLPFTGYYKLVGELLDNEDEELDIPIPIKIKTRKNVEVCAAHKRQNYIYYQLNADKGHNNQVLISKTEYPNQIRVQATIIRKKRDKRTSVLLSKIKYDEKNNRYLIPRKGFSRVKK